MSEQDRALWDQQGAPPPRGRSGSFPILETRLPEAGVDYPTSREELDQMLGTEGACHRYLQRLRFPQGFACPRCGTGGAPELSAAGTWTCRGCGRSTPVTEGTLFHGSDVPLGRWLRALWAITDTEAAASASALARALDLADPDDARAILRRLRALMSLPARLRLGGPVRVRVHRIDAGVDRIDAGAGRENGPAVILAMDARGGRAARIRARHLPRVALRDVAAFFRDRIEPGSRVITPPGRGFAPLSQMGFEHEIENEPTPAQSQELTHPQQVTALLELWLWAADEADPSRLQPHLDELTFRFNRRAYPPGLLFYRLVSLAVLYGASDKMRMGATG